MNATATITIAAWNSRRRMKANIPACFAGGGPCYQSKIGARLRAFLHESRLRRQQAPRHLRSNGTAYLMLAPMVVLLGIFVAWPLVYAFYLSFFEISFYKDARFAGFEYWLGWKAPGISSVSRSATR